MRCALRYSSREPGRVVVGQDAADRLLEAARRYVREAEEQVSEQTKFVEQTRALGQNAAHAEELLRLLQSFLRLAREHLAAVEAAARSRGDTG